MNRASAISGFVRPWRTCSTTWSSVGVRLAHPVAGLERVPCDRMACSYASSSERVAPSARRAGPSSPRASSTACRSSSVWALIDGREVAEPSVVDAQGLHRAEQPGGLGGVAEVEHAAGEHRERVDRLGPDPGFGPGRSGPGARTGRPDRRDLGGDGRPRRGGGRWRRPPRSADGMPPGVGSLRSPPRRRDHPPRPGPCPGTRGRAPSGTTCPGRAPRRRRRSGTPAPSRRHRRAAGRRRR